LDAQALDVEAALWAAIRALEDRGRLFERMADQLEPRGQRLSAGSFRRKAQAVREQAHTVRTALARATSDTLEHAEPGAVEEEGLQAKKSARGGSP
jgi:two-component system chemotaxis response regulator CheB